MSAGAGLQVLHGLWLMILTTNNWKKLPLYQVLTASIPQRPPLDFFYLHKELKRKGVTLMLCGMSTRSKTHGYQYSQFCDQYRQWCNRLDVAMRQNHRAGQKLFVACIHQWLKTRYNEFITGLTGGGQLVFGLRPYSESLPGRVSCLISALV